MGENKTIAIIDAGNTRVKLGLFKNDQCTRVEAFKKTEQSEFFSFLQEQQIDFLYISSVLSEEENKNWFGKFEHDFFRSANKLPISIQYNSPETLGADRLINACAAWKENPNSNSLVIDLGTCIKFDMVSKQGKYLGGSISPGIEIRLRALNEYTGKLPKIDSRKFDKLIGESTEESILSGVMCAIQEEINGFIGRYREQFADLTVFVTGGDAKFFDFPQKSNIFALENLTLNGLYYIYKLND